ncbi:SDR family NAD(P)-dependent oxidoreductase [Kamptonema cortianum]|nr:SDR family NAD(P)-dependent oxidoreductase [Kamptonema cortianum]MDL5047164.1 SDR family NAD(P)-dependent oxidoreductase [Oscillatoria amoena NRMC-F 0135]
MKPLNQHVVIITGASQGLGAGIAKTCARAGARVVLAARNEEKLEALRQEIMDEGGGSHGHSL